jgi:GntR family transcriptional regulator
MIKVNTSSFVPIYEQIKKELKKEIFIRNLKPNDPLPSIRDLATELLINPNTVARAYREMEKEGFIYTKKGKGCYVSDDSTKFMIEERKSILTLSFDEVIQDAKKYGLDPEEIRKLFEERLNVSHKVMNKGEDNG